MAKSLRHYKVHVVVLGLLGVSIFGLTSWAPSSKTAEEPVSKSSVAKSKVDGVDTVYYKERLKRLTDGSRYGSNAAVCHQALTAYYERKTKAGAQEALQTIQTQCRLRTL